MSAPARPDYDLFTAPPTPPSGPATDVRKFRSGRQAYQAWKATREGWRVWRYVEAAALDQAARGEQRISPRTLAAEARDRLHLEVNDHHTRFLAEDLVARHPQLVDLVERRRPRRPQALAGELTAQAARIEAGTADRDETVRLLREAAARLPKEKAP